MSIVIVSNNLLIIIANTWLHNVTNMLWSSMESQGIHIDYKALVDHDPWLDIWKLWSWLDDFQKDLAVFGWLFTRNGWIFWIKSKTNTGSPWLFTA